MERGIVIINTGNGKGKTTAAFGQALRAAGHNLPVCIIQFIKGKWVTGEGMAIKYLAGLVEMHVCGTGFTWQSEDREAMIAAAKEGWRLAREKIAAAAHRLVVLDELTYLVNYGIISEAEVREVLLSRPAGVDIVITGRAASDGLIALADVVTEMCEIKHPYRQGVTARLGRDF